MQILTNTLLLYYVAVIAVFCVFGLHRAWLVWAFYRHGGLAPESEPESRFEELPTITVQLPMYNERHVAGRIIRAACALDYPKDKLQIQVLDDSSDDSVGRTRGLCNELAAAGHPVEYRHRTHRTGFKAGALAEGLALAHGELVAMFDADFIPGPDFLRKTVDHFTEPDIGLVQARWGHLNRDESVLTRLQALCLDGHFIVEQTARARSGRWFNFNGTAGLWRRRAIDEAGGWSHDTLTEDTDLSYRAQMKGWRFRFLPDVVCAAELPSTVRALVGQQHRWNKGLTQSAIKLVPDVLRARAPWRVKLEACLHLLSPLPYAAMLLLTLLIVPATSLGFGDTSGVGAGLAVGLGLMALLMGTGAAALFYLVSQIAQGRGVLQTVALVPLLMAVGVGVSLTNTRAMFGAAFGRRSPFVRTPKFNGAKTSSADPAARRVLPFGSVEAVLGVLMIASLAWMTSTGFGLVGAPFVVLFAAGYLLIGAPPLRMLLERRERATTSTARERVMPVRD